MQNGVEIADVHVCRMGWKSGEGLGKNRQGMATPLVLAATDGGTARIMNASLSDALVAADPTARSADPNATRVVLLKNMGEWWDVVISQPA